MSVTAKIVYAAQDEQTIYEITRSGNIQVNNLTGQEVDIGFVKRTGRESLASQAQALQSQVDSLNEDLAAIDAI